MIKFTLLYLVILFVPTGVFASKVSLNELKVYLNNIKTLQAEFEQRNNDNSVSYGVLFIKKPNKLRMKFHSKFIWFFYKQHTIGYRIIIISLFEFSL